MLKLSLGADEKNC